MTKSGEPWFWIAGEPTQAATCPETGQSLLSRSCKLVACLQRFLERPWWAAATEVEAGRSQRLGAGVGGRPEFRPNGPRPKVESLPLAERWAALCLGLRLPWAMKPSGDLSRVVLGRKPRCR